MGENIDACIEQVPFKRSVYLVEARAPSMGGSISATEEAMRSGELYPMSDTMGRIMAWHYLIKT